MEGNLPLLIQSGIFIALLLTANIFDIRSRVIPDEVCLSVALTGFICFEPANLLGILTTMPLLIAALLWGGIGGGDIKLMAAAGIILGFSGGIYALILGLSSMLLFYAINVIVQKARKGRCPKTYPLAPFLSVGCIAVYLLDIGGITT